MKKRSKLIYIGMFVVSLAQVAVSGDVPVRDFGALPDDGQADNQAINQAVDACQPGDRLVFEKGTYDLRDSITIHDQSRLDVDGNGALLLLRGFDREKGGPVFSAIRLQSSNDVTIHDFTVDMDCSPNSAGEIARVNENSFDVRVFDEFPVTGNEYIDHVMTYYRDGRPNGNNLDLYNLRDGLRVSKVGARTLRIQTHLADRVVVGEYVCLFHKVYGGVCLSFKDVVDCTLRDVTVRAFPGMGFVARDRSTNVTLVRYRVRRPAGSTRLVSTNADGSKFILTGGMLTVRDCSYEGMGDDAINIHSSYAKVREIDREGNTLRMVRIHRGEDVPVKDRYVLAGDRVEFYDGKTMVPKGVAGVVERDGDALRLQSLPAGVQSGDLFNNISMTPKVRIAGVTVHRNRARGFLLQSQDVIVEDCEIYYPTGVGIFVTTDVDYWYESGPGKDVVIRNNTVIGANNHLHREGAITVKCDHDAGGTDFVAGVHRNIRIEGNTIRDTNGSAIFASATKGIEIVENIIERGCRQPSLPNDEYAIYLKNCERGAVRDNIVIHGGKPFGSQNCNGIKMPK